MAVWVRLLTVQYVEENGKNVTKYPGDWVKVSKNLASLWLSTGGAEIPNINKYKDFISPDAGLVVLGSGGIAKKVVEPLMVWSGIIEGEPQIAFKQNIIWDMSLSVRRELFLVGLSFLDRWDIAVPLYDYDQLALSCGTVEDRLKAKEALRDLRVLQYDTRLMFCRDVPATRDLIAIWRGKIDEGMHKRLAFLVALYMVKPLILALPMTWVSGDARP